MNRFVIFHTDTPGGDEQRLVDLSRTLGIEANLICVSRDAFGIADLRKELDSAQGAAMSVSTLSFLEDKKLLSSQLEQFGPKLPAPCLIWGFRSELRSDKLLARLSENALCGARSFADVKTCAFPRGAEMLTRQLSGCSFPRQRDREAYSFEVSPAAKVGRLMELGTAPAFVRLEPPRDNLFLWAGSDLILSPQAKIAEASLTSSCERFVPVLLFLFSAFGSGCWENPIKTARLIIDDPLLRATYGLLQYDRLIDSAESLDYGVTTAFIPWNFRRTPKTAAQFFGQHERNHSLCIHGCDHTNNEFATRDARILNSKASAAMERMLLHQGSTGLAHDKVMVFPQGKFSAAALTALRRAGFLAAVNSTRLPSESSEKGLSLEEELLPATNCYSGLPLFARRYPRHLEGFALDLFLGRPVHIVAHHDWFRSGCAELEACVQRLRTTEPALTWPDLSFSLRRHHLRRISERNWKVRFFTAEFEFDSPDDETRSFSFAKVDPLAELVESVTANGASIPFERGDGMIQFQLELAPRQHLAIRLHDKPAETGSAWTPTLTYRTKVAFRRRLSELRDNHLAKYPAVLRGARAIVKALKMTSDTRSNC